MKIDHHSYPVLSWLESRTPWEQLPAHSEFPARRFPPSVTHFFHYTWENFLALQDDDDFHVDLVPADTCDLVAQHPRVGERLWCLRNQVGDSAGILLLPDQLTYCYHFHLQDERIFFHTVTFSGASLGGVDLGSWFLDAWPDFILNDISFTHAAGLLPDSFPGVHTCAAAQLVVFRQAANLRMATLAAGSWHGNTISFPNGDWVVNAFRTPVKVWY